MNATIMQYIKIFFTVIIFALMYYSTFEWLVVKDWSKEDYSYGYLIPIISLYLIWDKYENIKNIKNEGSWWALSIIICGACFFLIGELSGEFYSLYLSSWMLLVGILWANFGWKKLSKIFFPVLILLTMFPPPVFIHNKLTLYLKLLSTQIGVFFLQWYGMSAYREGNVVDLGFTKLQVVDACSGLRFFFPLVIMALILTYLYKGATWKRAVVVLSAAPIVIVTNALRISITGVLFELWGPTVAEGFFHGFSGWIIFILGIAVLLMEMWVISGFQSYKKILGSLSSSIESIKKADGPDTPLQAGLAVHAAQNMAGQTCPSGVSNDSNPNPPAQRGMRALLSPPQFVVAVILLAATLSLAQGIEFREKIPTAKSLGEFPLQVGEWGGRRDAMDEKFIKELDLNDYVIVDYTDGSRAVNFYTAYYETQRKGESIHSPETCLPSGGWEFKNAGSVELPLADRRGGAMKVNRAVMEKGASKQLSYFWFPQRDRVLTNAWELKWYNFWDALTRQRTDGALVRLITPVYPNETVNDADNRLVVFTKEIVPVLNEFLPK